jgi:hypothetical protein
VPLWVGENDDERRGEFWPSSPIYTAILIIDRYYTFNHFVTLAGQ